jgi:hypothetical protein
MRVHAVEAAFGPGQVFETGRFVPFEGNPAGLAFTSRRPVLGHKIDFDEFPARIFQEFCKVMNL